MSTRRWKGVLGVVVAAAAALGGCADNSPEGIRLDLTPDLQTTWQRPVDVGNQVSITYDENIRLFWEDLHRASLVDRPSRLSKYPMPY